MASISTRGRADRLAGAVAAGAAGLARGRGEGQGPAADGRGHVVAAVAPPAEVDLRKRFMEELDPLDAELFEKTLFMLKGLPELGVLLQVEKELPALIRKVFGEHGPMFSKEDMAQWQKAEARLREALTDYARAARSTYQGRLFAEDALQGLRMIDHCREVFDVVVMNPPFGATADDFRFLRAVWEPPLASFARISSSDSSRTWPSFAKGGAARKFYLDLSLVINWGNDGRELKAFAETTPGTTHWSRNIRSTEFYFEPGITWPLRAGKFSPQVLPKGSVFSVRGYSAFPNKGLELATLALFASSAFDYIYKVALGRFAFPEFIVGVLQAMPWPALNSTAGPSASPSAASTGAWPPASARPRPSLIPSTRCPPRAPACCPTVRAVPCPFRHPGGRPGPSARSGPLVEEVLARVDVPVPE
jgi:hypothetical protein